MDKPIKTPMLTLNYFTGRIKNRLDTMNKGNAAKKGTTLSFFRSLFPNRLRKTVETLRSTHNNTPIFTILGNNLKHFRRKVLALVR